MAQAGEVTIKEALPEPQVDIEENVELEVDENAKVENAQTEVAGLPTLHPTIT